MTELQIKALRTALSYLQTAQDHYSRFIAPYGIDFPISQEKLEEITLSSNNSTQKKDYCIQEAVSWIETLLK